MKRANKFTFSPTWMVMLEDMQVDLQAVLAHAKLPRDLFKREPITLSSNEYFQLWLGLEKAAGGQSLPLLLAEHMSVESFDPAIFASMCSPDLNHAAKRLSQYKPLIGPMMLYVDQNSQRTELEVECYGNDSLLPHNLGMCEVIFLTQLARMATRQRLEPLYVELQQLPDDLAPYQAYFGCEIRQSDKVKLAFSAEDAQKPYLTSNMAMWDCFEANLNQRLAEVNTSGKTSERVRTVLLEMLPSGESSIEQVASRMAVSKRTLQRKLTSEAESFQNLLQTVRSDLADHYLQSSEMSLSEISFLLGFKEANSFIRAYSSWNGHPPGEYRQTLQ